MERRDFLKQVGVGTTLAAVDWTRAVDAVAQQPNVELAQGFVRPPAAARPHTWWHWMNGNVTADGITRDLEAMARVGVGGVQMFDVGTGIPKGPVATLSPEWVRLVQHAASEANRLGLSFTMHNCPGWSSSGGPWVTPDRAMQQLVWSETVVEGGKPVEVALPQPFAKIGYYRDALVLAYPSLPGEGRPRREQIARVTTSGTATAAAPNAPAAVPVAATNVAVTNAAPAGTESVALTDWDLSAGVDLRPAAAGAAAASATRPRSARSPSGS